MKTVFTALAALAITISVNATDTVPHNGNIKVEKAASSQPVATTSSAGSLQNSQENSMSLLNFNKTMQVTLGKVEISKLENQLANVQATMSFYEVMANTLQLINSDTYQDKVADLKAEQSFEQLMANTLSLTKAK